MSEVREGAVVVFSGGMDSTTVLALAISKFGLANVTAVSFNYGQKHSKELEQAARITQWYGISHRVIEIPHIFAGAGSTLIDADADVQMMGSYDDLEQKYGAQPTVVPNRNMNLIAQAVTVALTEGLQFVMLGVHGTDAANYHYPDCTPEFIGAMSAAIEIGNSGQVKLWAPYNHSSKSEIVKAAAELGAPLKMTQSCYSGQRPHCGECATCHERKDAFTFAGFFDPAGYVKGKGQDVDGPWSLRQFPPPFHPNDRI